MGLKTSKLSRFLVPGVLTTGLFFASTAFSCASPPPMPLSTYSKAYSPAAYAQYVESVITKCYSSPTVECSSIAFQNCGVEGIRAAATYQSPPGSTPTVPPKEQSPPPAVPAGPKPSEFKGKYPPSKYTRAIAHEIWNRTCGHEICWAANSMSCEPTGYVTQPWKDAASKALKAEQACEAKGSFIDGAYRITLPNQPSCNCSGFGCIMGCK